jgi:energy-coupling factor transport system substrate-specific component
MAKESIGQAVLGNWNVRTVIAVGLGSAAFGVLMVYGSIPVFTNTKLTLAMIVPVIIGGFWGPAPCFAALFLGNVLADAIGASGYWLDWSLGNGVLGFFIGAMSLYGVNIREGIFRMRHALIYAATAVLGNAVAFGIVTPLLTTLIYAEGLELTFLQTFAAGLSNTLVLVFGGIPILFLLSRLFARRVKAPPA